MTRILIVDPHYRYPESIYRFSLGLAYVASVCAQFGEVETIDFELPRKPLTIDEFMKYEDAFINHIHSISSLYNIIAVTFTTGAYRRAMRICMAAKHDGNAVICGGSHATILSQTKLWRDCIFVDSGWSVDAVFWSEAEATLQFGLQHWNKTGRFPCTTGTSIRQGDHIRHADTAAEQIDLHSLPNPAWGYFTLSLHKVAYLGCSRGCPYACSFCDERFIHRAYRFRSVEDIVGEIVHNSEAYGITKYRIADSTLGCHPQIHGLCQRFEELNLDLRWVAYCRTSEASNDPLLMDSFRRGGCRCVYFGFESGANKVLKKAGKQASTEQAKTAVARAREAGLKVKGSFILGLPGENEATIQATIEFAESLSLDIINWHLLAPSYTDLSRAKENAEINWLNVCTDIPDFLIPDLASLMGNEARHLWAERHIGFKASEVPIGLELHKCGMRYADLFNSLNEAIRRTVQNTEKEPMVLL